ncbi:MAG TPA: indole-3-glycerol phosphate synthase TrpC [Clostridiales bacterium]|nr:indole-3-glycerol phosphate synthase TrpC [Clostridiales bacterium]
MKPINDLLQAVLENKKQQLKQEKANLSVKELEKTLEIRKPSLAFSKSIQKQARLNIIAERKKASPSAGVLNRDLKIDDFANQTLGAQAVSILTERKYFLGHERDLREFKRLSNLPVLRKDFIIDEYDILKTAAMEADCMLLICAILTKERLKSFYNLAKSLRLEVLVEVHDQDELDTALELGARIIGINNRNLKTFETDIKNTERLIKYLPDTVIKVSESGIKSPQDAKYIKSLGVDAALVGTAFSKSKSISQMIESLRV